MDDGLRAWKAAAEQALAPVGQMPFDCTFRQTGVDPVKNGMEKARRGLAMPASKKAAPRPWQIVLLDEVAALALAAGSGAGGSFVEQDVSASTRIAVDERASSLSMRASIPDAAAPASG